MALPADNAMTAANLTSGEFKTYLNNLISEIATGDTTYVSTRSYVKSAIVIAPDYYRYVSQVDSNSGNDPLIDDGSNWRLDDNIINYFAAMYANGDESVVGRLVAGVDVSTYDYLVYADADGYTVWSVGAVTGTAAGDFIKTSGVDTGLSGALVQVESITESRVSNIEDKLRTWLVTPSTYSIVGDEGDAIITSSADLDSVGLSEYISLGDPTSTGLSLSVRAEVLSGGEWSESGYTVPSSATGIVGRYLSGSGVFVVSGNGSVLPATRVTTGSAFTTPASASSAPVRVWVKLT